MTEIAYSNFYFENDYEPEAFLQDWMLKRYKPVFNRTERYIKKG